MRARGAGFDLPMMKPIRGSQTVAFDSLLRLGLRCVSKKEVILEE